MKGPTARSGNSRGAWPVHPVAPRGSFYLPPAVQLPREAPDFDSGESESDITAMAPRTDIRQSCPVRPKRRGFTLIEAALTTFIIGTAVLATVQLFAACTQQNSVAAQGTTAMLLASHIQETM